MEFGKPIPEADEILEHSLMMPPPPVLDGRFSPAVLKGMARDVDQLINRLPYRRSQLPPSSPPQRPSEPQAVLPAPLPATPIGKYNPMGQLYRYEQAEFHLQVDKAEVRESSKTEQFIEPRRVDEFSLRDKESVFAEESLDNSQVKFPSHNYYIMFDRKHDQQYPQRPQHQDHQTHGKASRTVCLERKVQKLQKEVKMLRGATTSTSFRRSDGKLKLQRLLNSMIG